jgi:hypothetical protein
MGDLEKPEKLEKPQIPETSEKEKTGRGMGNQAAGPSTDHEDGESVIGLQFG